MPTRPKYALMSARDRKTILFTFLTSAVTYFDFLIYLYMAEIISTTFFPTNADPIIIKLQGLSVFAIGYVARPLGGIIFGRYADLIGRKPIILISILMTASSMLAMALLPTYAQWGLIAPILFILLRIIQGMSFGIYVPLAYIYVAEHIPRQYLSVGCSYVSAGFFTGVLLSNAFFVWFTASMTPDQLSNYGWRLPFMLAALLSFMPLLAWRYVYESPFFIKTQTAEFKDNPKKPVTLLLKYCKHSIFIGLMLSLVISSITTVVVLMLPELVQLSFVLDTDLFNFAHSLGIIFLIFGCVFYGQLSNYENFGKILIIGSVILIAQMFAFYYHLQASGDYILIMYALLGFCAGIVGMVPSIFLQLFPTNVRVTGFAFAHNVIAAIVGGGLPFALGYATMKISFSPALYIAFVGVLGIIIGFYFYQLPESKSIDRVVSYPKP